MIRVPVAARGPIESFTPISAAAKCSSRRRRRSSSLPVVAYPEAAQVLQHQAEEGLQDAVVSLEEVYKQDSSRTDVDDDGEARFGSVVRSGKSRRLSLPKRILLRKERLRCSARKTYQGVRSDDIWSGEAEQLIRSSFGVHPINWCNPQHGLLTIEEETELVELLKPMKRLQKLRNELSSVLRRQPSDEELSKATKMGLRTLRRKLQLGHASQLKLIQHNTRLVLSIARNFRRDAGGFSLEDLCQEGLKGLIEAVDHFVPGKGTRFSTYAVFWIRTSILRAVTRAGFTVRLPFSFAAKWMEIKKAAGDLQMDLGRMPTHDEIMKQAGLSRDEYWRVRYSRYKPRSLHETVPGTDEELLDYLPDTSQPAGVMDELRAIVAELNPKERLVLQHRYLNDSRCRHSLRDVGQKMKLSQEMVRKYELKALTALKCPDNKVRIRGCLVNT